MEMKASAASNCGKPVENKIYFPPPTEERNAKKRKKSKHIITHKVRVRLEHVVVLTSSWN